MRYVGIDWASEIHLVALLDASGSVLDQWEVEHTHRGIAGLLGRLEREGGSAEILVGIESGAPLLEDQLLDAGYTVYAINPKRADRFRDRHSPAGAKDDRRDARVVADAVRTDRARFVPLTPNGELTEELRMRDRACERAVQHRVRAELQLRAVLARFHPALLRLERALHDGFLLAMLEAYPDPAAARRARRTRVERLLKEHRIRALDADRILVELRAPAFAIRAGVPAAARDEALDLARQIRLLNEQIRQAHRRIKELFAHHDDHDLAMSLPGLADKLAPRILAELGDDERRRTEPKVLTVYAGVAPVTRATGTRKKPRRNGQRAITRVAMRRGCNRRLQTAGPA